MYNSVDGMVKIPYNIITEYTSEEFMTNFKAEFYEKNGNKPAKDFILSLEPKMKAKMFVINSSDVYSVIILYGIFTIPSTFR